VVFTYDVVLMLKLWKTIVRRNKLQIWLLYFSCRGCIRYGLGI